MTPVDVQKSQYMAMLDDSRGRTEGALAGIDPFLVVYAESGWRVKDLIAHLAAWESEAVKSLAAYAGGGEYSIPGFVKDDDYNAGVYSQHRDLPFQQILAQWASTREGFKAAIQAIPDAGFGGQIMCPWKKYSGIDGIVRDMINHEAEHIHDILAKVD